MGMWRKGGAERGDFTFKSSFSTAVLLKQLLSGVQAHIQSPLPEVRHVGMVVAECLMNKLTRSPSAKEGVAKEGVEAEEEEEEDDGQRGLKFEYPPSPETDAIAKLARPIVEQEEELQAERKAIAAQSSKVMVVSGGRSKDSKDEKKSKESKVCWKRFRLPTPARVPPPPV